MKKNHRNVGYIHSFIHRWKTININTNMNTSKHMHREKAKKKKERHIYIPYVLMIDVSAMNNEESINCEKLHVEMNCDQ